MKNIVELIGLERDLDQISRTIRYFIQDLRAPVVGAMQITCSDESERECIDSFQKSFVEDTLPSLKFFSKAPFRTANLGGRYEWGAVRIAEEHFSTPETQKSFKVLVVKINSHVSVEENKTNIHFGKIQRYHHQSFCCGALHALLDGRDDSFLKDLHEIFLSEEKNRIATLLDPQLVDPSISSLFAAVANARLQARHAILDIQNHDPVTPTQYYIFPCVTLNRPERDTELLCGIYSADFRQRKSKVEYRGLGDDPSTYQFEYKNRIIQIKDEQIAITRSARNHRDVLFHKWSKQNKPRTKKSEELKIFIEEASQQKHHNHDYSKVMLKSLLLTLQGLSMLHHVLRYFLIVYECGINGECPRDLWQREVLLLIQVKVLSGSKEVISA